MNKISPNNPSFDGLLKDKEDSNTLSRALNTFRVNILKILNNQAHGSASISPDANGNGTIPHGLPGIPSFVGVHILGDNVNGVDPESVDATNIIVRIKDAAGADVAAGTFTIFWSAKL